MAPNPVRYLFTAGQSERSAYEAQADLAARLGRDRRRARRGRRGRGALLRRRHQVVARSLARVPVRARTVR